MASERCTNLFEKDGPKVIPANSKITAGTHIDSCCLIIVWFNDGLIVAQHCQAEYIETFKIDIENRVVKRALAITAHEDADSIGMVKDLKDKIGTDNFEYYAYKEYNNAKPIVTILEDGFDIAPSELYHSVSM